MHVPIQIYILTFLYSPVSLISFRCKADVTDIFTDECFAKTSCQISANDDRLFHLDPCGELRTYLEVSHRCLPGKYIPSLSAVATVVISIL